MGELPQGHAIEVLGKNLCLYLPIGAWLVINLVMCVYNKLDELKYLS